MDSCDRIPWTELFAETLEDKQFPVVTVRELVVIHPNNRYPVFAVVFSGVIASALEVRLLFGFQDADLDPGSAGTFVRFQWDLATNGPRGVVAAMVPDPITAGWPLSTVPCRVGIALGSPGFPPAPAFTGAYAVSVTGWTRK